MPTRYSHDGSQEEGAALNRPVEGDSHNGLDWETLERVQELELKV